MASDEKGKGNSVSLKTFTNWGVSHVIGHVTQADKVSQVWCKTCAKHATKLRGQLKGQALRDAERYICGTNSVAKGNVLRHLNGDMHKTSMQLEKIDNPSFGSLPAGETGDVQVAGSSSKKVESRQPEPVSSQPHCPQPRIDSFITKTSEEAYRKMLKTAYILALNGLPLSHFKSLIRVQKVNGIQLIQGLEMLL